MAKYCNRYHILSLCSQNSRIVWHVFVELGLFVYFVVRFYKHWVHNWAFVICVLMLCSLVLSLVWSVNFIKCRPFHFSAYSTLIFNVCSVVKHMCNFLVESFFCYSLSQFDFHWCFILQPKTVHFWAFLFCFEIIVWPVIWVQSNYYWCWWIAFAFGCSCWQVGQIS